MIPIPFILFLLLAMVGAYLLTPTRFTIKRNAIDKQGRYPDDAGYQYKPWDSAFYQSKLQAQKRSSQASKNISTTSSNSAPSSRRRTVRVFDVSPAASKSAGVVTDVRPVGISTETPRCNSTSTALVGPQPAGAPATSVAKRIEAHFLSIMQNSKVSLLENFTSYADSLPVREYAAEFSEGLTLRLHELDYFVRRQDILRMAEQIMYRPDGARSVVRYVSSPSVAGKSASVLPAFLESTKMINGGTHYLYLSFSNNGGRIFRASPFTPSSDQVIAEKQGSAYILQCVKNLLEGVLSSDGCEIEIPAVYQLKSVSEIQRNLRSYLNEKLGDRHRIWFHIDEHRKMCDRVTHPLAGAAFSKGAMETIARNSRAVVIATYTEPPLGIPAIQSSTVCRYPVPLPPLDMHNVMRSVPELRINSIGFTAVQKRLLTSLKFRLSFKIYFNSWIIGLLHKRGENREVEQFLTEFESTKCSAPDETAALKDLNQLCRLQLVTDPEDLPDAAKFLRGMKDDDSIFTKNRLNKQLVSLHGIMTLSIIDLLEGTDPEVKVYDIGRDLFLDRLEGVDLLASEPLEAAYYWTLSCRSALSGRLSFFSNCKFKIKCEDLQAGRIFPEANSSEYSLGFLKKNIIYYADERNGKSTHPLGDMFFLSQDDELVVIDITGGNRKALTSKVQKMTDWIASQKEKIKQYTLRGVVLAPNVDGKSMHNFTSAVSTVCGDDAIRLLGGLSQVMLWLVDDADDET